MQNIKLTTFIILLIGLSNISIANEQCNKQDTTNAVNLLLKSHGEETPQIKKAVNLLFACGESVPGIEETLINIKTGKRYTAISHSIEKYNINIAFIKGKFNGAEKIHK